jgi:hypothetical protein
MVSVFVLFFLVTLGSCLTAEEQQAIRIQQAARASDGLGGIIKIVANNLTEGYAYQCCVDLIGSYGANRAPWEGPRNFYMIYYNSSTHENWITVDENGEYLIRFQRFQSRSNDGRISNNSLDWGTKTIYVSNDGEFIVNIP